MKYYKYENYAITFHKIRSCYACTALFNHFQIKDIDTQHHPLIN
jgi:hypothetical protein